MQRSYNSSKHSNNSPIKKNMMVLIDTNCIFLQVESIAIYIYILYIALIPPGHRPMAAAWEQIF